MPLARLIFSIAAGSATPIYRQVIDGVRRACAARSLATGDQLPSVRALAEQLVINPNTVARAYSELVRDGVLEARQGRGYFIAEPRQVYSRAERLRRLDDALAALVSEALVLDFDPDEILDTLRKKLAALSNPTQRKKG